jgi:hypothetical protein
MPYVLRHKHSNQLYTCMLKNHYKLMYYGTKVWEFEEDAQSEYHAFLVEQGIADAPDWELLELEENKMKVCNVKLKNNPSIILFLSDDGAITVDSRPGRD